MIYRGTLFLCILISYLLFLSSSAFADELKYPVRSIPDSLLKSANSVIRTDEVVFELKSIKKATEKIKFAVTILKKNAKEKASFFKPYDRFSKIKNIKGAIYDASGKMVKKIKQDDINDISANIGGGSLFLDSRIKAIDPEYYQYPYTIEYSCEIEYDGLLNYPQWQLYRDFNESVEHSSFSLIRPENLTVRILERGVDVDPTSSSVDGTVTLNWDVHNKIAIKAEPFSDDLSRISPTILLAPSDFLIDGFQGNAETWENFGSWIYTLNEGRGELSEETRQKILGMFNESDSDYEKAKTLYQYLQDNTRYISVQVGIGGWQPIEAEEVDRLSYGDCKALTNYMGSLLDIAGIKSYYTLVRAGANTTEIFSEFPSNQFNHAILCALIDNDTVWLECTSQRLPFGYIGSFTDDREVVLIKEDGGKLVRTKVYTENENQKVCNAIIELDSYGHGKAFISTLYQGVFYDEKLPVLLSDDHDQKREIRQSLHIPNFILEDYSLTENRDVTPSIEEDITVSLDGYGTSFGNRMAVNLNILNKIDNIPSKKEERNSDIVVRRSFAECDTILYKIPFGFKIDKISQPRNVQSEFGEFKTFVNVNESEVEYVRQLKVNKGVFPPDTYDKFYDFYNSVKKGDDDRMILIKVEHGSTQ